MLRTGLGIPISTEIPFSARPRDLPYFRSIPTSTEVDLPRPARRSPSAFGAPPTSIKTTALTTEPRSGDASGASRHEAPEIQPSHTSPR